MSWQERPRLAGESSSKCTEILGRVLAALQALLRLQEHAIPFVSRDEVKQFFETLRDRRDRPQRGYNSFAPQEPMHEVQVDLAFVQNFGPKPALNHPCALERSAETLSSPSQENKATHATASSDAYRTGQLQAEQSSGKLGTLAMRLAAKSPTAHDSAQTAKTMRGSKLHKSTSDCKLIELEPCLQRKRSRYKSSENGP